jgi:hypothetical protein
MIFYYKFFRSQKTHFVPITKTKKLFLFMEMFYVLCEKQAECSNRQNGQNAQLLYCCSYGAVVIVRVVVTVVYTEEYSSLRISLTPRHNNI